MLEVYLDPDQDLIDPCLVGFIGFAYGNSEELEALRAILSAINGVRITHIGREHITFDIDDVVDLRGFVKNLPRDLPEVIRSWEKYH